MNERKDESIVTLLEELDLEGRGWVTVDEWDADLCAIGIARRNTRRRLVYVSTHGKLQKRYDYECEMPTGDQPDDYTTVSCGKDVSYAALLKVIEDHLV